MVARRSDVLREVAKALIALADEEPAPALAPAEDRWMSSDDAMAYTRLSRSTLDEARKEERLRFVQLGTSIRYRRSWLDSWLCSIEAERRDVEGRRKAVLTAEAWKCSTPLGRREISNAE